MKSLLIRSLGVFCSTLLLSTGAVYTASSQTLEDSLRPSLNYLLSTVNEEEEGINEGIESLIEVLTFYLRTPLDLNSCSYSDLEALPLLDPLSARSIISQRETNGRFTDLSDLLRIDTFSPNFIHVLRPFVYLSEFNTEALNHHKTNGLSGSKPRRKTSFSQSIGQQLENPAGFSRSPLEGGFHGNSTSLFTRFISESSRDISFRMVMEKDPGEVIQWAPGKRVYGLDHIEAALSVKQFHFIEKLILGHYNVQLGQGLLFSSQFTSAKGIHLANDPFRSFINIRPSASRSEGRSFRGIAGHLKLNSSLNAVLFFSGRKRDASLTAVGPDSIMGVSSLQMSGLHRTNAEINKKNRLHESLSGIAVSVKLQRVQFGYTAYTARFRHPFISKHPASLPSLDFTGRHIRGWSFYGRVHAQSIETNWELAKTIPGSYAFLARLLFKPDARFNLVLLWRLYSHRFISFYGKGFGERSTKTRNETGIYIGSRIQFSDHLGISWFFDSFEFPFINSSLPKKPHSGFEGFAKLEYSPRSWMRCYFQFRFKSTIARSQYGNPPAPVLYSTIPRATYAYKLRLEYIHSRHLNLSTHIEIKTSTLSGQKSIGTLFYQDLAFYPSIDTKILLRFSIFDSNRNDTILYAFEKDLRYRFGIRTYSGTGMRNYIVIQHTLFENVFLEFKYAETRYQKNIQKGSGNSKISTSQIREISGQISWRI